jgi:hypothetical protein
MKKKTKTKTTENAQQQATFTPNNPTFVQPAIENLSTRISETFGAADPTKLAPGPTSLQTQALGGAAGLGRPELFGDAQTAIQRGLGGGPQSVERVNIADSIQGFMNPYLKDVVDTSLADFDFGAGMSRAQGQLARAGDETFGGSSGALQAALTEGELGRGRGSLSAGLRSGAFDRASSLAAQQAAMDAQRNQMNANFGETALQRQMQGGTALGALGEAQSGIDRANLQTQFGLGEAQRQIEKEQGNASIDALLKQISAFSGLPLDILKGYSTSGTSSGTSTSNTKQSGATLSDWLQFFSANAKAAAAGGGG